MKTLKKLINKYIFSDELPLNARMINVICLVGIGASLLTMLVRIITGFDIFLMFIIAGIVFSIGALMFICNYFHRYILGTWIALLLLCDVFFPAAFFSLSGKEGGM
ncbi:MAG: hypothetical protein LBH57_05745, partial [Treponema sp.]|nr:hypothetical protein [Treponema sp.]